MVFSRLEGQDILSFIAAKPRPNEEDIAFTIRPLLDVVNYLHGQKIVHLDIRVSWRTARSGDCVWRTTAAYSLQKKALWGLNSDNANISKLCAVLHYV